MQEKNIVTFNEFGRYGRLGNQLFQAAAVLGYAEKSGKHIPYLPAGFTLNMACPVAKSSFLMGYDKIKCNHNVNEREFTYNVLPIIDNSVNLHGYFQSEKYFEHCKDKVIKTFRYTPRDYNKKKFLGVHVRRGDYTKLKHVYYDLYEEGYYDFIKEIEDEYDQVIIFTDDKAFVKEKFPQYKVSTAPTADLDFKLLSRCNDIVMANSSFSWWAAYLNQNPDKRVYAPKKWFSNGTDTSDLYCDWMIKV